MEIQLKSSNQQTDLSKSILEDKLNQSRNLINVSKLSLDWILIWINDISMITNNQIQTANKQLEQWIVRILCWINKTLIWYKGCIA